MARKLRIVDGAESSAPLVVARSCKRPRCPQEVPPPTGRTRPPLFCSDTCRTLYARERAASHAQLLEARRIAAQYEILDLESPTQANPKMSETDSSAVTEVILGLISNSIDRLSDELEASPRMSVESVLAILQAVKHDIDRGLRRLES